MLASQLHAAVMDRESADRETPVSKRDLEKFMEELKQFEVCRLLANSSGGVKRVPCRWEWPGVGGWGWKYVLPYMQGVSYAHTYRHVINIQACTDGA